MATFTTVTKTQLNWEAPAQGSNADYFLNIGGYNLLVATGYKLVIDPAAGTDWTSTQKGYQVTF